MEIPSALSATRSARQDHARLDVTLIAEAYVLQPGEKLAVGAGRKVTLREAVEGIVVLSANDAAVAISEQLGGSEQAFAKAMTDKARQLGIPVTRLGNSS